jgi:hypothetical protein
MKRYLAILGFLGLMGLLSGCSSLLPASKSTLEGPWSSFEEAQAIFDQITPYKTTAQDLQALGVNLQKNPNITLLNYADVIRRFVPPVMIDGYQLDHGVADCIASNASCRGYEMDQKFLRQARYGNFWVDFLNFRRQTSTTGWAFTAVLLVKNDLVIYKITGGQPKIEQDESRRNPLGPFQAIDSISIIR